MIDRTRIFPMNDIPVKQGPVVYWMQRDQRMEDNWALLYAQEMAIERKQPLGIAFCLVPRFMDASYRQYHFMIEGLKEVQERFAKKNIPFYLLTGDPVRMLLPFLEKNGAGLLVTDFNPLKPVMEWKRLLAKDLKIAFHEVDAHNIIPCRVASPKPEFSARTLRSKFEKLLPEYLTDIPSLDVHPFKWNDPGPVIRWENLRELLEVDFSVGPVPGVLSGETEALKTLESFLMNRANEYPARRNLPETDGQSGLSPYLHFGQISAQRVALEVAGIEIPSEAKKAFLEELIVRRELSDNHCFYNRDYDRYEGFPAWARKTLDEHWGDRREYLYAPEAFENAQTHDDLWNAAQKEMTITGKMHGYMRMYWAKKLLEWTPSPEEALAIAIYLNDKYELDGRDPNGYAGIAWSIGGVHDRPWQRRPVFGMIRYMNYSGCLRKFDVKAYIRKIAIISASRS